MGCTTTLPPTARMKILNFKLCLPNVPVNILASTTTIGTPNFRIISLSNHCLNGGGEIKVSFPDLVKMARNTLAVPASGCSVERLFSVSGRIATWQRSRLRDATISDLMMYKAAMNLKEIAQELGEEELVVLEMLGKIPPK
jgi:hypothetical protein